MARNQNVQNVPRRSPMPSPKSKFYSTPTNADRQVQHKKSVGYHQEAEVTSESSQGDRDVEEAPQYITRYKQTFQKI